jgi:hypothetical protein
MNQGQGNLCDTAIPDPGNPLFGLDESASARMLRLIATRGSSPFFRPKEARTRMACHFDCTLGLDRSGSMSSELDLSTMTAVVPQPMMVGQ